MNEFNKEPIDKEWLSKWFEEFPQTVNKKILTLPARITKWKGVDDFIDLIKDIKNDNIHGLIVGPVSKSKEKYYQRLLSKVKRNNLRFMTSCKLI